MSTVKTNNVQIGQSVTATNNGTWYQPSTPDGTIRYGIGNAGATTSDVVTLTSAGNVGIGTNSPATKLHVSGTGSTPTLFERTGSNGVYLQLKDASGSSVFLGASNGVFAIQTPGSSYSDKLVVDSSGNLLVGTTSAPASRVGLVVRSSTASSSIGNFYNDSTTPYGCFLNFSAAAPNNSTNWFLYGSDSSANRFFVYSNGGIANYSANNTNLSDARLKTAITPAPSWLAKINAIEVVNFKYKDQTHEDPNLGVIAQQVLSVAPELVDESGFGETPKDGVPLMAIFETDLKYAMLKAIQELSAELNELKKRVG